MMMMLSRGRTFAYSFLLVLCLGFCSAPLFTVQPAFAQDTSDESKLVGQVQNPSISPSNPDIIAYERVARDAQELYLYNRRTGIVSRVQVQKDQEGTEAGRPSFLSLLDDQDPSRFSRYDGQLSWRPRLDAEERQWFAFVSSGGGAGFDLYLSYYDADGQLATEPPIRLAYAGTEQFPQWSPDGQRLIFVSGDASGNSDIYLSSNMRAILAGRSSFQPTRLTGNPNLEFYPVWSPDGRYIAYQTQTMQSGRQNWGISLIAPGDGGLAEPVALTGSLSTYDEYKPSWSPDGQQIAFYITQGEVGGGGDKLLQDIGVLALVRGSGSDRVSGRVLSGFSPRLAQNVVPHESRGPMWLPSPGSLQLIYVKRDAQSGFPIFVADFLRWQDKQPNYEQDFSQTFGTQNHRDPVLAALPSGVRIAFVSQEGNANMLQAFDRTGSGGTRTITIPVELSQNAAFRKSLIVPGTGQFYKGQTAKGALFLGGEVVAIGAAVAFLLSSNSHAQDTATLRDQYLDEVAQGTGCQGPNVPCENETFRAWQQAFDDGQAARTIAFAAAGAAVGIWVLNVLDSRTGFPRAVDRPVRVAVAPTFDLSDVFALSSRPSQLGLRFRMSF